MLLELYIENFVLIDQLTIPFEKGLNILTGETGAGKSILLGALDLILGGKFNKDLIKNIHEKSTIQGTFEINDDCTKLLAEHGIDAEDGLIMISRDMHHSGRSVLRANGRMVPRSIISSLGDILMDIHGQHEHQSLLNAGTHIKTLDTFAFDSVEKLLIQVSESYQKMKSVEKQLDEINLSPEEVQRELELIRYQIDEIEKADLKSNEDDDIENRLEYLKNFEQIHNVMHGAHEALSSDEGIYNQLTDILRDVSTVEKYDESIEEIKKGLETVFYTIEGLTSDIRQFADGVEYMPEELTEVENRLNVINDLKRKYGQNISDVLDYFKDLQKRLEELENHTDRVDSLKRQLKKEQETYDAIALKLSMKRQQAATSFDKQIMREINALNMKDAKFKTTFEPSDSRRQDGTDKVEFMISTNPGQPLRPLKKVVSGGELSRIMLSIKLILGKLDGIPSLVFDEVDTGISGKTASVVGEKLQKIADSHQVICVTHLPQIAVMADHHLYIEKQTQASDTVSSVRSLNHDERIEEIGRLIGGDTITETTRVHALELLELAKKRKLSS